MKSKGTKEKPLKAYSVQGYEYGCIVFATNSATARREGANQIDCEWEDIESCRRAPWADAYVQDRCVPPLVMIEHGWWFECSHCGTKVSSDSSDYDDDGNEIPHSPVAEGHAVYCTQKCLDAEHKEREERKQWHDEAVNATLERFPGVNVQWVSSCAPASVAFTFPGGKRGVSWEVGASTVQLQQDDLEAWEAFKSAAVVEK
ncbi:MAG: hypothetical protein ACRCUB_02595 [Plesiomonas shigelloides]